jgi:glycosyltransferase involved in cell wall biosynthesis
VQNIEFMTMLSIGIAVKTLRNINQNSTPINCNSIAPIKVPTVSIGIPVYNSERYLEETLKSLLSQGFQDFEIIISDNGSTDSTQKICQQYCAQDPRIHYHRSPFNRGPGWNYDHVFSLARGKYFKWQAYDDLLAPDFLEQCVAVLENRSEVVLCYCYCSQIDSQGNTLATNDIHLQTDDRRYPLRLRSLLMQSKSYVGCEIFGLMRMSTLQQAPHQGSYAHGDFLFICHLAFYGQFYQIPQVLFHYRIHSTQSMQTIPTHLKGRRRLFPFTGPLPATEWWDPAKKGKVDFPTWRFYGLQLRFIFNQSIPLREKIRCYGALMERLFIAKDLMRLGIDCLLAIETSLLRTRTTPKRIFRSRSQASEDYS